MTIMRNKMGSCVEKAESHYFRTSEAAISGLLHQDGRPVAFFSRTLTPSERPYSVIEREAKAIVESVRRWSHLLLGRPFKLITDCNDITVLCFV